MTQTRKLILIIAVLFLIPYTIGMFLPKERVVEKKAIIDKMYFFILADITNHWEENSWRQNLDTMIQQEQIDGQEAWMEYYSNGDSILLCTQKLGETDYVRMIHDADGKERVRSITLVDVNGKTAIRLAEEVYTGHAYKRFLRLLNDKDAIRLESYLFDLKEKHKPDPNAPEEETFY